MSAAAPLLGENLAPISSGFWSSLWELTRETVVPVVAQFASSVLKIVGIGFVIKLGSDALIAANPMATAMSFFSACTVIYILHVPVRRVATQGASTEVGAFFCNSIAISVLLGLGVSVAAYFTGESFGLLGHGAGVATSLDEFFHAFVKAGGVFPLLAAIACRRLMAGLGKSLPSSILNVVNTGLMTVGSIIAWANGWGMEGFGYAQAVGAWLAFLGFLAYLAWDRDFKDYALFDCRTCFEREKWQELFVTGAPTLVSQASECLIVALLSGMVARLGDDAASAYTVANQFALFAVMPSWIIAIYAASLMTKTVTLARAESKRGKLTDTRLEHYRNKLMAQFHAALFCAGTLAAMCLLIYFIAPQPLVRVYTSGGLPATAEKVTQNSIRLATAGSLLVDGPRIASSGVARVFDRNNQSLAFNFVGLSVGLGLAVLAGLVLGYGVEGMIVGFYLGVGLASLQGIDIHRSIRAFNPDAANRHSTCWYDRTGQATARDPSLPPPPVPSEVLSSAADGQSINP